MKMPWLLRTLAVLLVVVPATLAMVLVHISDVETGLKRRWCPGCYSSIMGAEYQPLEDLDPELLKSVSIGVALTLGPPSLEDSVLTKQKGPQTPCVGCFGPLDVSKVAARAKREERRAASVRRRGKLPGTRPVCRGCFSGLMLTGRPAKGGIAEGTVPKSISESEENSSGGD